MPDWKSRLLIPQGRPQAIPQTDGYHHGAFAGCSPKRRLVGEVRMSQWKVTVGSRVRVHVRNPPEITGSPELTDEPRQGGIFSAANDGSASDCFLKHQQGAGGC